MDEQPKLLRLAGVMVLLLLSCGRINNNKKAPLFSKQSQSQQTELEEFKEQLEDLGEKEAELKLKEDNLKQKTDELDQRARILEEKAEKLVQKDGEQDLVIEKLAKRLEAAEKLLSSVQDSIASHEQKLVEVEYLRKDINIIFKSIDTIQKNNLTKEEFKVAYSKVVGEIERTKEKVNGIESGLNVLTEDQKSLSLNLSDLAVWKESTNSFLENLQRTDISAAVSDLQRWKKNINIPLESIMIWYQTAEDRVSALESFTEVTKQCFNLLNPISSPDRGVPGTDQHLQACGNVYTKIEDLQRLFAISNGIGAKLETLKSRLLQVEGNDEEHLKLISDLQILLIKDQFASNRVVRPCNSEMMVSINSSIVFTQENFAVGRMPRQELIPSNSENRDPLIEEPSPVMIATGIMGGGDYHIPNICEFNVIRYMRKINPIEKLALGMPGQEVISLPALCWKGGTVCHSVFGEFNARERQ